MEDVVNAQPFDLSSIHMLIKDVESTFVVLLILAVIIVTGVLPVLIPGVWLGTLAFEHALNRQIRQTTITVRSVLNQIKVERFLNIVVIN